MNMAIAAEISLFAINNGISLIKLDDSNPLDPVIYCKVKRMDRKDEEIRDLVLRYKEMYVRELRFSEALKIRYRIIE